MVFDIAPHRYRSVVDLNNDAVLGTKATYNKQAASKHVITRIMLCQEYRRLEELHHVLTDDMNEMPGSSRRSTA